MRRLKSIAAIALAVIMLFSASAVCGRLLMPVRYSYGSTWEAYLQEEKNSVDVLFFGSSLVYCDVIPAKLWENTGLSSYVMAGPEQTIPISCYYIKEACKTQKPQAICLEVTGMFFREYQNYTKVNIDYMPWGLNRAAATIAAAEKSELTELFFPLLCYHDRVYSVETESVKAHLNPNGDNYAGYTLLREARAQNEITERNTSADTENYAKNLKYLKKINEYCKANDIMLILYIAPVRMMIPKEALTTLEKDIEELDAVFFDCNDESWAELKELDNETVWYDILHYNFTGAVPFTEAFSKRLAQLGLKVTHENDESWQERAEIINKA